MNKSLKKSLIIYTCLALVLTGMATVSYAITATDADAYLTRSEFAVDISTLQLKLDEAESGLFGKINKYRSSDVKFVTYDTPNKYRTGNSAYAGLHNGGNWFLRPKTYSSGNIYGYGPGDQYTEYNKGYNKTISIYRLYNGNYYITNGLSYNASMDAVSTRYLGGVNFAVPVENLPGWYFVFMTYYQAANTVPYYASLIKLDPNVPYPANTTESSKIQQTELILRLKKDLFVYSSPLIVKLTENVQSYSGTANYYSGNQYMNGLNRSWLSDQSTSTSRTIYFKGWLDSKTGDYMISIRNMRPSCSVEGNFYQFVFDQGANNFISRFMPADNVEYVMGSQWMYHHYGSSFAAMYPNPLHIGDGLVNDPYYEYEFVDCVNGIKYWHAYKKPSKVKLGTSQTSIDGAHYSLPIVY